MPSNPRYAVVLSVLILTSCGHRPEAAIDPELAACIPANTVALAGLDLEHLRNTSFYPSLSQLPAARDASYLLIAYSGRDILFVARGKFAAAPPGATMISSRVAVSGSPEAVHAAVAQNQAHDASAVPRVVDIASTIAGGHALWIAAQGSVTVPLEGNLGNLNRILRLADSVTIGARIESRVQLEATGTGRSEDAARQMEESLRAMLTFAGAAAARSQPDLATTLRAVELRRDGVKVQISLSADSATFEKIFAALTR